VLEAAGDELGELRPGAAETDAARRVKDVIGRTDTEIRTGCRFYGTLTADGEIASEAQ
jgi:hypothetical protein